MRNIYALIDCDNFYVSCERIFRPDLIHKPVLVLSNNDGCVVARSKEVKNLGIPMGIPYFKIEEQIKEYNISVFSSNYSLYSDISHRMNTILEKYSPNIEVYSIDESFLGLSIPSEKCTKYCIDIRQDILHSIGIPTTVGIAYTKTLTKIASKVAKKDTAYNGVLSLLNSDIHDTYLKKIEVGDIWGVGRVYSKWLNSINIHTALDFKYANRNVIKNKMGVNGLKTLLELNNIECIPLDNDIHIKKSIVDSKSFGKNTDSLIDIKQSLSIYTARASEKLRKQECVTEYISVFLISNPFKKPYYSNSIGIKLPYPISDTPTLIKYSLMGLEKIYKRGYMYKKTGVIFTNISPTKNIQFNFNIDTYLKEKERRGKIMESMDRINMKWGRDTLKVASMGISNRLKMKQGNISPRYTTSWEEILSVKI